MSWDALYSFIRCLDSTSATFRAMHPDMAAWSTQTETNAILANIYDLLAQINANLVAIGSHQKPKKPKPYPRPGVKDPNKYGEGAVTHEELKDFFARKRKEHVG